MSRGYLTESSIGFEEGPAYGGPDGTMRLIASCRRVVVDVVVIPSYRVIGDDCRGGRARAALKAVVVTDDVDAIAVRAATAVTDVDEMNFIFSLPDI